MGAVNKHEREKYTRLPAEKDKPDQIQRKKHGLDVHLSIRLLFEEGLIANHSLEIHFNLE